MKLHKLRISLLLIALMAVALLCGLGCAPHYYGGSYGAPPVVVVHHYGGYGYGAPVTIVHVHHYGGGYGGGYGGHAVVVHHYH